MTRLGRPNRQGAVRYMGVPKNSPSQVRNPIITLNKTNSNGIFLVLAALPLFSACLLIRPAFSLVLGTRSLLFCMLNLLTHTHHPHPHTAVLRVGILLPPGSSFSLVPCRPLSASVGPCRSPLNLVVPCRPLSVVRDGYGKNFRDQSYSIKSATVANVARDISAVSL